MDIYEIIQNMTTAVAEDDDVRSFSTITYGHECTVMENMDAREPPLPEECPIVIFFPVSKQTGTASLQKVFIVGVSVLVYDDSKPVDIENVTSFTGGRTVETLRRLILAAILNALKSLTVLHLEKVDMDYNPIDQYPYNDIAMELTITAEQVIGGDFYE